MHVNMALDLHLCSKMSIFLGHLGINSCLCRARDLIFWPRMSTYIREYVEKYGTCSTYQDKQPPESLYVHETPELPWQKVGIDLYLISDNGPQYTSSVMKKWYNNGEYVKRQLNYYYASARRPVKIHIWAY